MNTSDLWDKGWLNKVDDIYILKMFMPFPLKENNCFLAESDSGWAVIDTGVNLEQNRDIFAAALSAIGISWKHINSIYLTHYHHDHIGLAGWLQEKTMAPVYLPEPDIITWQNYIASDAYLDHALATFLLAAWPLGMAVEMADDIKHINSMLEPRPVLTPLHPDQLLNWAGKVYNTIPVPGHTDGHCVFHSPESRLLFSGDNVIAHTNLHLTDWPQNRITNPCDMHLSALEKLGHLPVDMVLPGHGNLFSNLNERIEIITAHHNNRKAMVYDALQNPVTAWELAQIVFQPNTYIHIRRLVMAETLAYLQSLVSAGLVECDLVNGSHIYRRSSVNT